MFWRKVITVAPDPCHGFVARWKNRVAVGPTVEHALGQLLIENPKAFGLIIDQAEGATHDVQKLTAAGRYLRGGGIR